MNHSDWVPADLQRNDGTPEQRYPAILVYSDWLEENDKLPLAQGFRWLVNAERWAGAGYWTPERHFHSPIHGPLLPDEPPPNCFIWALWTKRFSQYSESARVRYYGCGWAMDLHRRGQLLAATIVPAVWRHIEKQADDMNAQAIAYPTRFAAELALAHAVAATLE